MFEIHSIDCFHSSNICMNAYNDKPLHSTFDTKLNKKQLISFSYLFTNQTPKK